MCKIKYYYHTSIAPEGDRFYPKFCFLGGLNCLRVTAANEYALAIGTAIMIVVMNILPDRMKTYMEFILATLLRLVIFTD